MCTSRSTADKSLLDSTSMATAALQMPESLEGSQPPVSQGIFYHHWAVLSEDSSPQSRESWAGGGEGPPQSS